MKTLDCCTLETLIENAEPVELLDVRPREQFSAAHIPGARSLPFAELVRTDLRRRKRRMGDRVYVISDDRASASLASGILHASRGVDAVVIDGGMQAWLTQGFPVLKKKLRLTPVHVLTAGVILLGALANIAVALNEFTVAALLLMIAAMLLLKTDFRTSRIATEPKERIGP